jgi:dsRNA-specific ribonuclease
VEDYTNAVLDISQARWATETEGEDVLGPKTRLTYACCAETDNETDRLFVVACYSNEIARMRVVEKNAGASVRSNEATCSQSSVWFSSYVHVQPGSSCPTRSSSGP